MTVEDPVCRNMIALEEAAASEAYAGWTYFFSVPPGAIRSSSPIRAAMATPVFRHGPVLSPPPPILRLTRPDQ